MKVLTPDEMRLTDETCIRRYGIPAALLMESAASSTLFLIERDFAGAGKVLLVCGSGNNGGDGFALARKLHAAGREVSVLLSGSPERMTPETLQNFKCLENMNVSLYRTTDEDVLIEDLFSGKDLIVDALLGIGLSRDVSGEKEDLIRRMNASPAPVLSLDIPSGLDGRTGTPRGCAVKAAGTVSFGCPKLGNVISPGHLYNGRLSCSRISFPPEAVERVESKIELNIPAPPAERDPLGYKNSFGRVMVIGGGRSYYGAPVLAAEAAYRCGAGYVTAAIPRSHAPVFSSRCTEAVLLPLEENGRGCVARSNRELILDAASRQDCILLGPGLTDDPETVELIRELIPSLRQPLVIDADGLGALAGHPELTKQRESLTVITPHRGEQRRLLEGRGEETTTLESLYNAVCVYKGPRSRIACPDGRQYINPSGCAALGTAGTGDVLAGMISGMIPWETTPAEAVRKAVLLHGLAAQRFKGGEESLCAGDLIRELPSLFKDLRRDFERISRNCFGVLEIIP